MITTPEEWSTLTDAQRYSRLTRAELERDNAVLYSRDLSGHAGTYRQKEAVRALVAIGDMVLSKQPA